MTRITTLFLWAVCPVAVIVWCGDSRAENKVLSLLWSRTAKVDDFGKDRKLVSSGFDSGSSTSGKFVWKGDQDAPLVVYDPQQRKIVNEETLIGRWTYGGRNYKKPDSPREPWRDAFEALATLDRNRDSAVSGRELQVVSLWFDRNRDGQAQADEVSAAASVGLAEISLRGNTQALSDGSQYYRQGYRRYTTTGELLTGPSVGWSIANASPVTPTPVPTSPIAVPSAPTAVSPTVVPPTRPPPPTAIPTPTREMQDSKSPTLSSFTLCDVTPRSV